MTDKLKIKVAIIDMNNGNPNQGMRGILEILEQYAEKYQLELTPTIFDCRQKNEVPDLSYDIYIASGGPGSPFEGEKQEWERKFFNFLDQLSTYNLLHEVKKHAFLICHSFQLACIKYKLGTVTKRKSNAFGIFPMSLTKHGEREELFKGLPNPFYSVDSRDWQVVDPDLKDFKAKGAKILAIEKERPHVGLERCVMAIRFTPEIIGTQFHPEANPVGMKMYLLQDEKKTLIIENHGKRKYEDMLHSLADPTRITLTQSIILPNFLTRAIEGMQAN